MYSTNLAQVVDIVVSHQGIEIKTQLIGQLMSALVLPAPEHYRPLLRRLAALSESAGASSPELIPKFSTTRIPHGHGPASSHALQLCGMASGNCCFLLPNTDGCQGNCQRTDDALCRQWQH